MSNICLIFYQKVLTQTTVCFKMVSERVIRMKIIERNKGVLILYVIIMICSLVLMNDVKKENNYKNNSYVMVNNN